MGSAISYFPMTGVCMLIASLSLSGVPFLTGCYSKDHILELACCQYTIWASAGFFIASFTAGSTAAYSTRLISLSLTGTCAGYHFLARKAMTEVNNYSTTQFYHFVNNSLLCLLALASLLVGLYLRDVFIAPANPFLGQTPWIEPINHNQDGEFLNLSLKLIPLLISILGILLSCIAGASRYGLLLSKSLIWEAACFMNLLSHKWYVDLTVNHGIVLPFLNLCDRLTFQVIDKGLIEILGPSGSNLWQEWQTGIQSIFTGHLFHSVKMISLFTTWILSANLIQSGTHRILLAWLSITGERDCDIYASIRYKHVRAAAVRLHWITGFGIVARCHRRSLESSGRRCHYTHRHRSREGPGEVNNPENGIRGSLPGEIRLESAICCYIFSTGRCHRIL